MDKMFQVFPIDTFYFGTNRPKSTGEASFYETRLLPMGTTVYGALRASLMENNIQGHRWKGFPQVNGSHYKEIDERHQGLFQLLGDQSSPGSLRLYGPFLCQEEFPLFPLPTNLLQDELSQVYQAKPRSLNEDEGTSLNGDLRPLQVDSGDKKVKCRPGQFLKELRLEQYLRGGEVSHRDVVNPLSDKGKIALEHKPAIAMDYDINTAKEGMFFSHEWLRFEEDLSLCFWMDTGDLSNLNLMEEMFIGGERRFGRVFSRDKEVPFRSDKELKEDIANEFTKTGKFFLYLATPGDYEGDWKPPIDESKYSLVGAMIDGFIPQSGWDMRERRPRPLKYLVPAGTVYFYQTGERHRTPENFATLWDKYMFQSFSSGDGEGKSSPFSQAGFGLTCIGTW